MSSPAPRVTRFEIVPRAPVAAPAPPALPTAPATPDDGPATRVERPLGVALIAALGIVYGIATLLGSTLAILFALMLASDGGPATTFFGALMLPLAIFAAATGGAALAISLGLWRGRTWARLAAIGLTGMYALGALATLVAGATRAQEEFGGIAPAGAIPGLLYFAILAAIPIYLLTPRAGAYFGQAPPAPLDPAAPATAAAPGNRLVTTRTVYTLLAIVGVSAAMVLAWFPMQSLVTPANGATLERDATFGFTLAGAFCVGGVAALLTIGHRDERSPLLALGVALPIGGLLAFLLVEAARAAAHEPVYNGRATGDDPLIAVYRVVGMALVATLIAVAWRAPDPSVAMGRWGGSALLAMAIAAFALSAFVMTSGADLQSAAAARPQRSVPSAGALLTLAAMGAAALAWRRARR